MSWELLSHQATHSNLSLRVAICGGENFDSQLVKKIETISQEIYNVYGPTETTVWSTIAKVSSQQKQLTIGKPIANTQVYILDPQQNPVPVGIAGEICIGGAGLSVGYLNNPQLTQEKFLSISFDGANFIKIYRTGDWGFFNEDGNICFLGRQDDQFKLRGYRIELSEIEYQIKNIPYIRECCVCLIHTLQTDSFLVAFYIKEGKMKGDLSFDRYLRAVLPEYMIPHKFIEVQSFPFNINNKVDKKALSKLYIETQNTTPGLDIETILSGDDETTIQKIWESVLGIPIDDLNINFFDLGGNSFLLNKVRAEIEKELSIKIELIQLFINTSISKIAEYIKHIRTQSIS